MNKNTLFFISLNFPFNHRDGEKCSFNLLKKKEVKKVSESFNITFFHTDMDGWFSRYTTQPVRFYVRVDETRKNPIIFFAGLL